MVGFSQKKESEYLPQQEANIFLMIVYFDMTPIEGKNMAFPFDL